MSGRIIISGDGWKNCYLHDKDCKDRKKQVLRDLSSIVRNNVSIMANEDLLTVECKDHSSAFEQFEVVGINHNKTLIRIVYHGGGS